MNQGAPGSHGSELSRILSRGAEDLALILPPGAIQAFESYHRFLEEQGRDYNLTTITGEAEVARLHFLDCIALLSLFDFRGARVIDVGSGAGFPGVPLKIAEPSIELTLLDSAGKKMAFLSRLCRLLDISASCVGRRAEDAAGAQVFREQYDIAVSRAVARLNVLCELCLPFIRTGGMFIAMKGADSADEIEESRGAIKLLGAELLECRDYTIPGTDVPRRAVLIKKILDSPDKYPRRFSKIKNSPL